MRTANLSDKPKPVTRREATFTGSGGVLRGQRGQRDGTEMLGTWENLPGASGVSRAQPVVWRSNKSGDCRGEVGEAHSSNEAGESRWSEGALATDKLTQNLRELIGR